MTTRSQLPWTMILLGTMIFGCSSGTQSLATDPGETGSLNLQIQLANGAEINVVEYVITRGGMEPMSGTIDTSAPGATASVEVFGLEPGDGYRVTMTAQATDEQTQCTGATDFAVTVGEATDIMVVLKCKTPPRFGAVRVNGKLNVCAELTKMVVSPLQTSVGSTIDLSAAAEDTEGDDIAFMWTAQGGDIADDTAPTTTFTCTAEGEGFVAVSVSDDGFDYCDASGWTVAVTCVGDGGGTGGSGGSGGASGAGGSASDDPTTDSIATRPLSSMMAVSLIPGGDFDNIPDYTKSLVDRYAKGEEIAGFPLSVPPRDADVAGVLDGLTQNLVVKWFDAITPDLAADAPRFGSNADYLAYFGDDWDADWQDGVVGSGPMFNGSADAAWMWSNHEYISNDEPLPTVAPVGQYLTLATFLTSNSLLSIVDPTNAASWTQDVVDDHILWEKVQHGGSWLRVERQADGSWRLIRHPDAKRYDSTDATLTRITGYTLAEQDTDDSGQPLPQDVVVGITADCSGGQTPWGTVFTAEENAQSQWGDLEATYVSSRQFVLDNANFRAGMNISPDPSPSEDSEFGRHSDPNTKHNRDVYGFLVEIDPGQPANEYYESLSDGGDGIGHRKLGSMGRARWENMDTVTDADQGLIPGQPIVFYAANDRRAGRVYKWVSESPYMTGMTRAEVRALLDQGKLYVGHWADLDALTGLTKYDPASTDPPWENCASDATLNGDDDGSAVTVRENCPAITEESPGTGIWIELSVDNAAQLAPNADANGSSTTVGDALKDVDWNGIGGFASDNDILSALFTASTKLGVRELNRPEDVEWNPVDETLYVAFTYHGRTIGMKQDGTLIYRNTNGEPVSMDGTVLDPGEPLAERGIANLHTFERADNFGSIFAVKETGGDPATSLTFDFYPVFFGSQGDSALDTARPDNLSIDADGGVWFGTDGNTSGSTNASADGIHYLDLDPAHKAGAPGVVNPTYGLGFRILHSANDAEATGPAWNSTMDTIFYNAQHPGEFRASEWPSSQPEIE
ncbi:MAG: alkaline phosphatase PhoX [Myxococcota bacterium]